MEIKPFPTPSDVECSCPANQELKKLKGNHHKFDCPNWTTRDLYARKEGPYKNINIRRYRTK